VVLSALLASTSIFRAAPLVASAVVHVAIAGALVVSGGHATMGTRTQSAILEAEVDVTPELVAPPRPEQTQTTQTTSPNVASRSTHTHTHTYPVGPSHDARPHSPSEPHEHAAPELTREAHPAHEEPAAPVSTAAALHRFTLPSGSVANSAGAGQKSTTDGSNGAATPAAGSGPTNDAVFPASSVQVSAKLVHALVAAYPVDARADDLEGDVLLEIVVDREGHVVDARIARRAGHGFDEAALLAIRGYRFSPAEREGHRVRVRMPWSVQFRLR
jgi:TonB family protein